MKHAQIAWWFFALFAIVSCSEKTVVSDEPAMAPTPDLKVVERPKEDEPSNPSVELRPIFFEYDKDTIRSSQLSTLKHNANWLKANPEVSAQIEGHCDERGSQEYNLKLGESRALAVKTALVRLGIEGARLSTISYGAIPGQSPSAWPTNRKAVFVIIYPK